MTLVAARLQDGIISAVSDTAISFKEEHYKPEKQVPKLCILSPDLAVGFAGEPTVAIEALTNFPQDCITYKAVTDYLLDHHTPHTEFLVMFNKPVQKIIKIAHGEVTDQRGAGWIGWKPGYD